MSLMKFSDLHTFFIYVFFGYFLIFPLTLLCRTLFRIDNPRQRMQLYLYALVMPFAGFFLYHTILTKRCQAGVILEGPGWRLFDALCRIGTASVRVFAPLLALMLLIGGLKAAAAVLYLYRTRKLSVEPDGADSVRVNTILTGRCAAMGMDIPPVIYSCRDHFVAFTAGFFRPAIVLSAALLPQLTDRELEGILTHELFHIRRGDTISGWVLHLARDIMFFSPFSTMLLDRYLFERERLCDSETVRVLGAPRQYAATLVKVWKLLMERREVKLSMAVGFTGRKGDLEKRVVSLLEGCDESTLPGMLFFTILFTVSAATVLYLGLIC